ncbi:MAG: hypothetical protein IJ172_03935 [Ruminococcus sp.]|nr:hypothetical protein [Ruminococcus sp.]
MAKKIISALLALTMLFMTACGADNSTDTSKADTTTTTVTEQDSSEIDSSSDSEETTTTTAETTTATSDTTTTTENSTTTTTKAQAPTTTKNTTQATTQATAKPVQTTKATTKATTKVTTKATTKATQATPTFNAEAYINQTIAEINSMFPQSQFNRALYDRFERLCKGVPTNDDLYQIKEQLCNYGLRKYNGKKGTFTYYQTITPTPKTDTVTAAKPISITIDRTLVENDAHQNNGADTVLVYCNTWTADRNYKNIRTFIKKCYEMVDSGVPALVELADNKRPEKTYNHKFYVYLGLGGYDNNLHHNLYYLWFCNR